MKKAGDVLKALMQDLEERNSSAARSVPIFRSWEGVVGTDVAAHCRLVDIEKGFLKVEVDHPGWVQMLKLKENKVVSRLAREYRSLEIKGMKIFLTSSH